MRTGFSGAAMAFAAALFAAPSLAQSALTGAVIAAFMLAGPAAAQQKVRIGFISTFSGPQGVMGQFMKESVDLAVEHLGGADLVLCGMTALDGEIREAKKQKRLAGDLQAKIAAQKRENELEQLRNTLVNYLSEKGEMNAAAFRDLIGSSRKYIIPLLEYFDRVGVTIRIGDIRKLKSVSAR